MAEKTTNIGESGLGACECFADVIRRQGLRFEAAGRKPRAAMAALPGIRNEQNVRRWGPVPEGSDGGVGGEHPNLGMVLENFRHWPRAMQLDLLMVLTSGSELAISVGPPDTAAGLVDGELVRDAMANQDQAAKLTRMAYEATLDGELTNAEAGDLRALGEGQIRSVKSLLSKTLQAVTFRPLGGRGGR